MPRIAAGSLIAYLASQLHDVWACQFWKRRKPGTRLLWLRNNASTMVGQLLDTAIFTTITFFGVFESKVFWQVFWSAYLLKWVVAALDTPFVYIATWTHRNDHIPEAMQTGRRLRNLLAPDQASGTI
jgi:queuosine precursor transporter